jgi:hypothetical protein
MGGRHSNQVVGFQSEMQSLQEPAHGSELNTSTAADTTSLSRPCPVRYKFFCEQQASPFIRSHPSRIRIVKISL